MPDIPAKAVHDMGNRTLFIDGDEFPFTMDATGPILANRPDGICTVTLTILVDAIEVLYDSAAIRFVQYLLRRFGVTLR